MSEKGNDVFVVGNDDVERQNNFTDGLPPILSPKYDLVFKSIFLKEELLESMLLSVIDPDDKKFLRGLRITNPQILPEYDGGKLGILDIKVVVESGKIINVEMQKNKFANYRERIVSYISGMVREQVGTGEEYGKIRRVISITITAELLIPEDDAYHHRYTLYDPKTCSEFTDLLEVHIIELPKLPKEDDGSELWKWMKFIDVEKEEDLKMIAATNPVMEKAAVRLRELSEDQKTRQMLQSIRRREADDKYRMEEALQQGLQQGIQQGIQQGLQQGMQQGIEKGIEKGIEEGIEQEKRNNAKAMKRNGIDAQMISTITGLSLKEISLL